LARQFAATLNHVLATSAEPQKTLSDFVANMSSLSPGMVGYVPADTSPMQMPSPAVKGVPQWFTDLLAIASPSGHERFPIMLNGTRLGDLVVMPDSSADIYEKWVTLLAILGSALMLALLASIIVYFTVGAALHPIYQLSDALAMLRAGNYRVQLTGKAPKELEKSLVALNELAATLARLREENSELLRRVLSAQDDERNELSRELHDELGPLLFAIRANAGVLRDAPHTPDTETLTRLMEAAEALQQVHRRILERLRPMHLKELGLTESIRGLLRNLDNQVAPIDHTVSIDPCIDRVDEVTGRTIYRVVQEALTNVMRHANARRVDLAIQSTDGGIRIRVADDGAGFAAPPRMGRGLTGMRERVRALGGKLSIEREHDRTVLTSFLPAPAPAT
jgi:two-component system sensor histidine kinase UhpB